jgi:pimeloyl-ACP methyl ester carboxylesterase
MNRPNICAAAVLSLLVAAESRANDAETRCLPTAPGECLQVTISGEGRDVVLIPGLFGSAFGFRKVIPLFMAKGFRTIVVEPLGVGSSARPRMADYTLTAQADRIQ